MLSSSPFSHARDAAAAALALSGSLCALSLALGHAESEFPTLVLALAATLVLQVAGRMLPSPRARAPNRLDLLVRVALQHLPAIVANGARILVQNWARADALIHFGVLFAFLIECVGELLLPQVLNCYHRAYVHRHSGANAAMTSCALTVAGFLMVAGINAFEYGSLVHSAALIALSLGMKLLEQRQSTESMMRVAAASCPFFVELSTAVALVLWTATWLYRKQSHLSAARQVWKSSSTIASTVAGLLCSLAMSAMASQDGWLLRGIADIAACSLVVYAQHTESQSAYSSSKLSDLDMDVGFGVSPRAAAVDEGFLDTYRAVPSEPASVVAQIAKSLWERDDSRKILMFLSVNVSYMFVELAVGFWTNSLGLIGDAGHMLFDNSALVIGLVASYIGKLPPDEQFTYGYGRVEVLSGFLNSMLLLLISFHLLAEAGSRFFDPPEVSTDHLLLTSVVGLLVNIVGLVWFHDHVHSHGHGGECGHGHAPGHGHAHGHGHSHGHDNPHGQSHGEEERSHDHSSGGASNSNMYGVYLHVLADTLGSVGVIISSLLIEYKNWHIADPLSSSMIALLIFGSTLPLLKETLLQLLQRVPRDKERDIAAALREVQATVPGVQQIERWHVWQHAHDVLIGSLQLVVAPSASEQLVMERSREIFRRRAQIDEFLTIQVLKREGGVYPSSQGDGQSVIKASGAFGFGGGAHAHAHAHDHHHHDHDHQHDHYHDKLTHQEPPSVMSTHENPVSEDVRFGRQGRVVPPAVQFHHHQHQHQHGHDASLDPRYEHDVSVAPPAAVRLADGFVSQRKPPMDFPGAASIAKVNNQVPEAFAPRPVYAPSATHRPFPGDASRKHM